MVKLICKSKRCLEVTKGKGYVWDYNGLSTIYASCPKCLSKVPVKQVFKEKVKKGDHKNV